MLKSQNLRHFSCEILLDLNSNGRKCIDVGLLFLIVLLVLVSTMWFHSGSAQTYTAPAPLCTLTTVPVPGGGQTAVCYTSFSGQLTCSPPYTTCSIPPPISSPSSTPNPPGNGTSLNPTDLTALVIIIALAVSYLIVKHQKK